TRVTHETCDSRWLTELSCLPDHPESACSRAHFHECCASWFLPEWPMPARPAKPGNLAYAPPPKRRLLARQSIPLCETRLAATHARRTRYASTRTCRAYRRPSRFPTRPALRQLDRSRIPPAPLSTRRQSE